MEKAVDFRSWAICLESHRKWKKAQYKVKKNLARGENILHFLMIPSGGLWIGLRTLR